MEVDKETKTIDLKKYKSSVENSPLLSCDEVEVKAYTTSLGQKVESEPVEPQNTQNFEPKQPGFENNEAKKENPFFKKHNQAQTQNFESEQSEQEFTPPPNEQDQYLDDGIDPMDFSEHPEMDDEMDQKEAHEAAQVASGSADMLIGLYSSSVPPILADMAKSNIGKIKEVLSHNKQIPGNRVKEIEKFLHTNNKEIEKALQLTPEQVQMLKSALSKVLEQYNLQPTNPIVNLIMVVATIAVMQYMTVSRLIKQREEELLRLIETFQVTVPEGMENAFKKKKLIKKKKEDLKEAA